MRQLISLVILIVMLTFGVGLTFGADADFTITSPKDGSTLKPDPKLGRMVIVQFEVKNFEIKDFTKATDINEHEGHAHIQLDDNHFNTMVTDTVWVFGNVEPGPYMLVLVLVHNNHTPLSKPLKKTVHFTME